jgi:hypothetical protein
VVEVAVERVVEVQVERVVYVEDPVHARHCSLLELFS